MAIVQEHNQHSIIAVNILQYSAEYSLSLYIMYQPTKAVVNTKGGRKHSPNFVMVSERKILGKKIL